MHTLTHKKHTHTHSQENTMFDPSFSNNLMFLILMTIHKE